MAIWARTWPQSTRDLAYLPVFPQFRTKTQQRSSLHWTHTASEQLLPTGYQMQKCFVELNEITGGICTFRIQMLHQYTLSKVTRLTSLKKAKIEHCDIWI